MSPGDGISVDRLIDRWIYDEEHMELSGNRTSEVVASTDGHFGGIGNIRYGDARATFGRLNQRYLGWEKL